MAKGPLEGVRVPVKLPWPGLAHNDDQFVSMKKPVAELLKLATAKKADLTYKSTLRYKKRDGDGNPTGNMTTKTVTRIRRPGYRQRSIKLIFGNKKTGVLKHYGVGNKKVSSVNFPVTKSVSIEAIVTSFRSGEYANLPVVRVVDMSTGQGYPTIA